MSTYIPFIITVILFMLVPGPSVSVIVANTLRYNLSAGVKTVIGTVSGAASMFIIYAFGFDLMSKNFQTFLNFVQWIGILFLFYMGFVMIRDSKNLNIKLENKNNKSFYLHGFLVLWSIWQISTLLGIFLGSIVPDELGLAYTIPLTFIALLVNYFRKIDHLIVILVSGILSLILFNAPLKSYIILSSLTALFVGFLIIKFKKGNNS